MSVTAEASASQVRIRLFELDHPRRLVDGLVLIERSLVEEAIRSTVFLAGASSTPGCFVGSIVNTELALALPDACVEQAMPG